MLVFHNTAWNTPQFQLQNTDRGRLTVILNFFHFQIFAPTVVAFSPNLLAYCPVAHPSLVQVYNVIPGVLRQLSGLAHCGEVGV